MGFKVPILTGWPGNGFKQITVGSSISKLGNSLTIKSIVIVSAQLVNKGLVIVTSIWSPVVAV